MAISGILASQNHYNQRASGFWPTSFYVDAPIVGTKNAIFGYGTSTGLNYLSTTNTVSNTGVVSGDIAAAGTARRHLAGTGYGTDKGIFGYGVFQSGASGYTAVTNKVSNTGVVATDTTGVGTARVRLAAACYGTDKAIFGYGSSISDYAGTSITNLVSNTGVVANDLSGIGTAKFDPAAAGYGGDKAIFAYGTDNSTNLLKANLVSNTGVVASDTNIAAGTSRSGVAAAGYGGTKAIFGNAGGTTNLLSNTGVFSNDVSGVGTARYYQAAASYGNDKAIFGYGSPDGGGTSSSVTNLVSNTGVVATDTSGVGTARRFLAAVGYSLT